MDKSVWDEVFALLIVSAFEHTDVQTKDKPRFPCCEGITLSLCFLCMNLHSIIKLWRCYYGDGI